LLYLFFIYSAVKDASLINKVCSFV